MFTRDDHGPDIRARTQEVTDFFPEFFRSWKVLEKFSSTGAETLYILSPKFARRSQGIHFVWRVYIVG